MRKLTKARIKALELVNATPGKSGRFYRDLGVALQTLSALENLGLLNSQGGFFAGTPVTRSWQPTDAGRAALSQS